MMGVAWESIQPTSLLHFPGQLAGSTRMEAGHTAVIVTYCPLDAEHHTSLDSEGDHPRHHGDTAVLPQTRGEVTLIERSTEPHQGTNLSILTDPTQFGTPFLVTCVHCCLTTTSLNLGRYYRCLLNRCHFVVVVDIAQRATTIVVDLINHSEAVPLNQLSPQLLQYKLNQ